MPPPEKRRRYRVFHWYLEGADPSYTSGGWDETSRANTFMNAVSSNYPNASSWNNLGQRTDDPDAAYYKTAQDSDELNGVFQEIFDEIKTPGTSPTAVEEGFAGAGGYITFTDTLGDYMTVKGDTMTVVFANQPFAGTRQDDGTFAFAGEVPATRCMEMPNSPTSK